MTLLKIELPPDALQRLEALARRNGYDSPDEYLRAVVDNLLNDDSDEEILADLKEAWREAQRGEGMSVEDLWKFVENDD
jgi:Arc/MetJ-type ribon-helix-helix transcriptional regulator